LRIYNLQNDTTSSRQGFTFIVWPTWS